jgi:hypothetical protein
MSYSNPGMLREELLGVSEDDLSDLIAESYIEKADQWLIVDISTRVRLEVPTLVDTKTYKVANFPLADVDADSEVTELDVEVFAWENDYTFDTLEVDSVLAEKGIIILKDEPDLVKYKNGLTVNYSFYPNPIDFKLVSYASAQLAAYLYLVKEFSFMPLRVNLGRFGVSYGYRGGTGMYPPDKMLERYQETLGKIKTKPYRVVIFTKQTESEREIIAE